MFKIFFRYLQISCKFLEFSCPKWVGTLSPWNNATPIIYVIFIFTPGMMSLLKNFMKATVQLKLKSGWWDILMFQSGKYYYHFILLQKLLQKNNIANCLSFQILQFKLNFSHPWYKPIIHQYNLHSATCDILLHFSLSTVKCMLRRSRLKSCSEVNLNAILDAIEVSLVALH